MYLKKKNIINSPSTIFARQNYGNALLNQNTHRYSYSSSQYRNTSTRRSKYT